MLFYYLSVILCITGVISLGKCAWIPVITNHHSPSFPAYYCLFSHNHQHDYHQTKERSKQKGIIIEFGENSEIILCGCPHTHQYNILNHLHQQETHTTTFSMRHGCSCWFSASASSSSASSSSTLPTGSTTGRFSFSSLSFLHHAWSLTSGQSGYCYLHWFFVPLIANRLLS